MTDTTSHPPVILWFRQDLRLTDNRALFQALSTGQPILPLYILEDKRIRDIGAAALWWLHQSLKDLENNLNYLCFRRGCPKEIFKDLIAKTGATQVFWTRRYDPEGKKTDLALETLLSEQGISCHSVSSSFLFEPGTILNKSGKPFQIFTPYWKHCREALGTMSIIPRPPSIPVFSFPGESLNDWNLKLNIPNWATKFHNTWAPGEKNAQSLLTEFIEHKLDGYEAKRNYPAQERTSRLSPHLHWGEISPRQIWNSVQNKYYSDFSSSKDVDSFLSELGWREFSHDYLHHFPNLASEPLRPEFINFPWEDDPRNLQAWQMGQTGYPIVDAGMRELWHTGWMHNRVRMITASFLIKDLLIPWQKGEAWFWDTLLDADEANNALNWQWVAGCGVDAAPYFRIFNPVLQGEKFDPNGDYLRKWLPELKNLPTSYIHTPWLAPPNVLRESQIKLDITYPTPIVDHTTRRKEALNAYKNLKSRKKIFV